MTALINRLKRPFDKFYQTLLEGHYRPADPSLWLGLFKSKKKPLPETVRSALAQNTFGTTRTIGKRAMWGTIASLLAMKAMITVGLVMLGTGMVMLGYDYIRSLRTRRDIITETNFAGQVVTGSRADLCRLYQAQMNILSISSIFKKASMETTKDTVDLVLQSVGDERKRVQIIDSGRYGAPADIYEFSEHSFKLVGTGGGLKEAWEKHTYSDEEIISRLVDLERGLPPHIVNEVQKRLTGGGDTPSAPAPSPSA